MSRVPPSRKPYPSPNVAAAPNEESTQKEQANYPEYPGKVSNDTGSSEVEDGLTDDDGWFLNEKDYIDSRQHLNSDGSLNLDEGGMLDADEEYIAISEKLLQMQSPEVPSSFFSTSSSSNDDKDEPTLERLLQYKLHDPTATSEELHKQVFQEEQGFLNQSNAFQKSLGTNDTKAAMEAAKLRRGAEYRKRQADAIAALDKEIQDLEETLLYNDSPKNTDERCFQCGCALSEQELHRFRAQHNAPASRRLCLVCHGEALVAKSDQSFFQNNQVLSNSRKKSSFGNRRRDFREWQRKRAPPPRHRQNVSPPTLRDRAPAMPKVKPTSTTNTTLPADNERDDIELLKEEVRALQDELQHFKEDAEDAQDFASEYDAVSEEEEGPWSEVIDPDTGEVFYWNEETGEMKWDF